MLHLTRMLTSKLVIVAALLCLASLSAACVAVPASPGQPDGAPQTRLHPRIQHDAGAI